MKPRETTVRIFGNGMMDFRACYDLPSGETPFEFSFQKNHLDDVLSTLKVSGQVTMPTPPTFTANNAVDTRLRIEPTDPIRAIMSQMAGARIEVTMAGREPVEGRLSGMETTNLLVDGQVVPKREIHVVTKEGDILGFPLSSVSSWRFVEETDRAEVEKSLDLLYNEVRPGSTLLRFKLKAGGDPDLKKTVPAVLQWVVPDAAYLMTYRLVIDAAGKFRLDCWATIHNMTDEPWDNTTVSVVSGQPHTFRSNGADAQVSQRKFVRLIEERAAGGETVAEGSGIPRGAKMLSSRAAPMAASHAASFGDPGNMLLSLQDAGTEDAGPPPLDEASTTDVGDMQVFTSPASVRIPDKKSASIFLFSREVEGARLVLVFGADQDSNRPNRAFRLTNTTGVNLPRGSVAVFEAAGGSDVWMGKAIMEATKQGQQRIVVFATDSSVTVDRTAGLPRSEVLRVRLQGGNGHTTYRESLTTHYWCKNRGDQDAELILDHRRFFHEGTVTISGGKSRDFLAVAGNIHRCTVTVPPGDGVDVVVDEVMTREQRITLDGNGLVAVVAGAKENLMSRDGVRQVLAIAAEVEKVKKRIAQVGVQKAGLEAQHKRAMDSVKALGDGKDRAEYVKQMGVAYEHISEIENVRLPDLAVTLATLVDRHSKALRELDEQWGGETAEKT